MQKTSPTLIIAFVCFVIYAASGCSKPEVVPVSATPSNTSQTQQSAGLSSRPNVVWILLDACRAQNLSCYGYDRQTTPNLDALAARGVVFDQAFSQSNWTARSVPSYMTGKYFAVSCLDLGGRVENVRVPPEDEKLLPGILRGNDYYTALFSAHLSFIRPGCRLWNDFDEAHLIEIANPRQKRYKPDFDDINRQVIPWLEQNTRSPFFLYVHSLDTHFPHTLSAPDDQWVDPAYDASQIDETRTNSQTLVRRDGKPFTDADKAYFRALYDGGLHYADRQVGVLMDALRANGQLDNTIIVVSSDHGENLGEDGQSFEHTHGGSADEVFHVPLIMAGPGIPNGVRVKHLVQNVDIVPTLIDLLHLNTNAKTDGKSLAPAMRDPQSSPPHSYAFAYRVGQIAANPPSYDDEPAIFIRSDSFKYDCDPTINAEFLWQAPDSLVGRKNVIASQESVAADLRSVWQNDLKPLRVANMNLPVAQISIEGFNIVRKTENQDIFVEWGNTYDKAQQNDNKWSMQDRFIWCAPNESPQPIRMNAQVPNGAYRLFITMSSTSNLLGNPASSVTVQLEDGDPVVITTGTLPPEQESFVSNAIGKIEVKDETFSLSIEKGIPGYWCIVGKIVLVPERTIGSDKAMSLEEINEQIQKMESPGHSDTSNSSLEENREQEEALKSQGYL